MAIYYGDGSNSGSGRIVQVKQTFKNNTASTNSGSFAEISGLTVSITPSSSSNKILFSGCLYLAGSSSESNYRLKRDSTIIGQAGTMDDLADGSFAHGGGSRYSGHPFSFLDSPSSTSSITYSIAWRVHSGTTYLNRTWDTNWFHGASSVTAMEIAS
jgi:hypothetical protein